MVRLPICQKLKSGLQLAGVNPPALVNAPAPPGARPAQISLVAF